MFYFSKNIGKGKLRYLSHLKFGRPSGRQSKKYLKGRKKEPGLTKTGTGILLDSSKREPQKAMTKNTCTAVPYSDFDTFQRKMGISANRWESWDFQKAVPEIPKGKHFLNVFLFQF